MSAYLMADVDVLSEFLKPMTQFCKHTEVRVEYAIILEIEGQQLNSDLKGFIF